MTDEAPSLRLPSRPFGRTTAKAQLERALITGALLLAGLGLVLPSGELPTPAAGSSRVVSDLADGRPPDRLVVPTIGLDAKLVPIEVDQSGVLSPPDDVDLVGWWKRSAHPGQRKGQTVLTGHTVSRGGGVMNRLGNLGRGEEVRVHDDGRVVTYEVTRVFVYSTAEVAEHAVELFGQDRRGGRLVLVTCTDWNGSDYESNIIVHGKPVAVARTASAA